MSSSRLVLAKCPAISQPSWLLNPALIYIQPLRHKGHSKWQNIQHTKAANDQRLAKIAAKYAFKITTAIRGNGGETDPAINKELARTIKAGLSEGLMKSTLDKAIKNSNKSAEAMVESIQEIRGPGNCFILVEMLTKSAGQANSEVRKVVSKRGGMMDKGMLNMFDQRGQIIAKPVSADDYNNDKAEEDAIEMGAEEAEFEDGVVEFLCHPNDFADVKEKAEAMKFDILDASVRYIPSQIQELTSEKEQTAFDKLIEGLEDNPFVTAVHHNVVWI